MPPRRVAHPFRSFLVSALLLSAVVLGGPARADDYAEVQRLQAAGQNAEALALVDRYISEHPRDPQMRFLKANLLSGTGHADEAQTLLIQLTHDYPELAEPWNNLAVLYASQGKLEQARDALHDALRVQPDYATALENLGDVQVRLALQAYMGARRVDAGNARVATKIESLRKLSSDPGKPAN